MSTQAKGGRSALIQELREKGFSVRKATRAVNAVFDRMTLAVKRGEIVEIPGGWIHLELQEGKPRREWHRFKNVRDGKPMHKIVQYRGRRPVVKFRPDPSLDVTPLPAPPPPEPPEQIECRQLASDLLGRAADAQDVARLQEAADFPTPKPGALVRRLRAVRDRGWNSPSPEILAQHVRYHYWV